MVRKAMRLNPHYPEYWTLQLGPIFFDAHQYPEAITTLESLRLLDTIGVHLYLAASHAALGHVELARAAVARVLWASTLRQRFKVWRLPTYRLIKMRKIETIYAISFSKQACQNSPQYDSARVANSTGQNALP